MEEFTHSDKAIEWKLDNTPPKDMYPVIRRTCEGLERIRTLVNNLPIKILSGYRSKELNKIVGGVSDSQHRLGEAADIVCPEYGSVLHLARLIEKNKMILGIDQVINEFGTWVHVSFSFKPRFEALTITKTGTTRGIV